MLGIAAKISLDNEAMQVFLFCTYFHAYLTKLLLQNTVLRCAWPLLHQEFLLSEALRGWLLSQVQFL